jgi:Lrp/AsnC family leucine-responsive transcriptional regulator
MEMGLVLICDTEPDSDPMIVLAVRNENIILDNIDKYELFSANTEVLRMIDETSMKILKILQEKARIPNVEVARQVGMAPSAVLERIRKLEKQGYIDGYEVRLNPEKFGRSLVAFVEVAVQQSGAKDTVGQKLAGIPEVLEVHFVTGEDSYLVKLRVADARRLGAVVQAKIASLPQVTATRTSIAMHTLKETWRIPIEETGV